MHWGNYQKHQLETADHGKTKNYRPLKDQFTTEKEYGAGINKTINGMHTREYHKQLYQNPQDNQNDVYME